MGVALGVALGVGARLCGELDKSRIQHQLHLFQFLQRRRRLVNMLPALPRAFLRASASRRSPASRGTFSSPSRGTAGQALEQGNFMTLGHAREEGEVPGRHWCVPCLANRLRPLHRSRRSVRQDQRLGSRVIDARCHREESRSGVPAAPDMQKKRAGGPWFFPR